MKTTFHSPVRTLLLGGLLLLTAPAFWACSTNQPDDSDAIYQAALDHQNKYRAIDDTIIQGYLRRHQITRYNRTDSGIYLVTLTAGTGTPVSVGKQVGMNYTGKFIDAAHENLTFETGSNYPFMPGYTSVMPGWTEGVLLMRQGDRVELIIPSYLAYGPTGYASYVAPDTPIRFEMEILSVN